MEQINVTFVIDKGDVWVQREVGRKTRRKNAYGEAFTTEYELTPLFPAERLDPKDRAGSLAQIVAALVRGA